MTISGSFVKLWRSWGDGKKIVAILDLVLVLVLVAGYTRYGAHPQFLTMHSLEIYGHVPVPQYSTRYY